MKIIKILCKNIYDLIIVEILKRLFFFRKKEPKTLGRSEFAPNP
jgi:hypothetical protein